ncbi:MAG: GFA family protein [Pseudomonadota bacterium]
MTIHRGHCRCEGITVEISQDAVASVYCHCDDCRRSAGAPVIASVGFNKAAIAWTADTTVGRWVKGTCTRLFCSRCGTPVAQEHEIAPERTYFYTAFMEKPELFPPQAHAFAGEKLGWLELADTLEKHERGASIDL